MSDSQVEKWFKAFPEGFYDILAYLIPSVYLLCCSVLIIDKGLFLVVVDYFSRGSWLSETFIYLIILSGLYFIGQMMTAFSYYTVFRLFILIANKLRRIGNEDFNGELKSDIIVVDGYSDIYLAVKRDNVIIALEMTKRYARWMLTRNIVFASLVLIILNFIIGTFTIGILVCSIFVLSTLDFIIRTRWLSNNFRNLNDQYKSDFGKKYYRDFQTEQDEETLGEEKLS